MPSTESPRSAGRPRDERADREIITATVELIAESGAHALRVDDVARRAGVGKATIYRRYRTKHELITEAVGALVSEIEIPDSGSTEADLLTLCRRAVDLYGRSLAAKVMPSLIDEMSRSAEFAALQARFLSSRRGALREVIERGVTRGDLRPDIDVELALDVLAGPLFYRLLITGGPIDDRLAQGTVELMMRGFAATPATPRRPPKRKDQPR